MILKEGRQREVRRLWEALGFQVSRLMRIRFGPVSLPPHLRTGHHVDLDEATTAELYQSVELPPPALSKKPVTARVDRKHEHAGVRSERTPRHGRAQRTPRRQKSSPR